MKHNFSSKQSVFCSQIVHSRDHYYLGYGYRRAQYRYLFNVFLEEVVCCSDNVLVPSVLTLFQKNFSTGPEIEDSVVSANDLSTDNIRSSKGAAFLPV